LPWKDTSPMQQRKAFIDEYLRKEHSVSELCRRFGVSRKTAYNWIVAARAATSPREP
jgi:putative transposase